MSKIKTTRRIEHEEICIILSALILVMSLRFFAADHGTTAYAVKPVIDGQIDEIWEYTSKQVLR